MFNSVKKDETLAILGSMCMNCGVNHSNECPLYKAKMAVSNIPTEVKVKETSFFSKIANLFK